MSQVDVLNLFNCMVVGDDQKAPVVSGVPIFNTTLLDFGVVLDFVPTNDQLSLLKEELKPLNVETLFTREERNEAPIEHLFLKQFLHYVEVYGLDSPGLFDLTTSSGTIVSLRFVKGISVAEVTEKVHALIYTNAPVKNTEPLFSIIGQYAIDYDFSKIQNNEMRIILYRDGVDKFDDGDDMVRYMCYKATGQTLLIKSKEVIAAVGKMEFFSDFFGTHENVMAQVFNRHKRIILAAKKPYTARAINRIARKSKTKHVPIRESIAKIFVSHALKHPTFAGVGALSRISVRDKLKYLNILAKKNVQSPVDSFKIRNGKVYTKADRPVYEVSDINRVEAMVLRALAVDLIHLRDKTILLDANVDYGLPVSRKQTLGRLPFGTTVRVDGNEISSGMYWENSWGASDLDLSTIDAKGRRVGWGQRSGFDDKGIVYSGDLTDARNGAMEFMTSRTADYGLFVNIYTGEPGAELELVVGSNTRTKDKWFDEAPLIREKHTLDSRSCLLGFVKGKTFVVYAGRLNDRNISGANPILAESEADFWTLESLFKALNIQYDVDRQEDLVYDHDLTYNAFSYDKLEEVFTDTKIVP